MGIHLTGIAHATYHRHVIEKQTDSLIYNHSKEN